MLRMPIPYVFTLAHLVDSLDMDYWLGGWLDFSAWSIPEFFGSGSEFQITFGSGFNRFQ